MYIGLNAAIPTRTAAQIYARQSKVREITDANIWNLFYDHDKIIVVAFWAKSCPDCNGVAEAMVNVANRFYTGPHGRIKFYHAQWDRTVNPKIFEVFGFKSIPVVYFYYTSTGKPPTRECSLLEASLPRTESVRDNQQLRDPERYIWIVQNILKKHPKSSGTFKAIDFFDRIDFHFAYLGRLHIPWCRNSSEIRLISRADLTKAYQDNRKSKTTMSDWAINLPGTPVHRKLFPQATDSHAHVEYDFLKIEQQTRSNSLILQVDSIETQRKQLNALFDNAKKTEREQGLYIVVERKKEKARLYFLPAIPKAASRDEFVFSLSGENFTDGQKIRYVPPGDLSRQVIGTLHTHYIKSTPVISQTSTVSTTIHPGGKLVERITHKVSDLDIRSATDHQIVVYALEADQIHKAMPNGRAVNGMKRNFNVLVDALASFSGKTRP